MVNVCAIILQGRVGDERDGKTTTESVAAALDFFGDLTSGERPGPQEERDGERGGELAMTGERKRVTGVSRKRKSEYIHKNFVQLYNTRSAPCCKVTNPNLVIQCSPQDFLKA